MLNNRSEAKRFLKVFTAMSGVIAVYAVFAWWFYVESNTEFPQDSVFDHWGGAIILGISVGTIFLILLSLAVWLGYFVIQACAMVLGDIKDNMLKNKDNMLRARQQRASELRKQLAEADRVIAEHDATRHE